MMRGVKRRNFWIMEQLGGAIGGCWMPMGKTPRPGVLKGMALQAIAHGADQVLHFRWRSSTTGAPAVIRNRDGALNSYEECKK